MKTELLTFVMTTIKIPSSRPCVVIMLQPSRRTMNSGMLIMAVEQDGENTPRRIGL